MTKKKACTECGGTGRENDRWMRENGLPEPICRKCKGKGQKPPKASTVRPMTQDD